MAGISTPSREEKNIEKELLFASTAPPTPDYGRRLLPILIDEKAESTPDLPFVSIPVTSQPRDGFVDISYGRLAKAIDRCSWYIEEKLGKGYNFATLGYMGPLDLRYIIFMFAAVKVGYKVSNKPAI